MAQSRRIGLAAAALAAFIGGPALAVTVEIPAARDTMILANSDTKSNGSGRYICIGVTGEPAVRRALLQFDLVAAGIPAGSTITSVTLDLTTDKYADGGSTFDVHRLTQDWGEGTSDATSGECRGITAASNDATWRYRFYAPANPGGSPQWSVVGGTFIVTPSASALVGATAGHYTWSSSGLVADVQGWLNSPTTNFGWLVKRSSEAGSRNAIRFHSRQSNDTAGRPKLTINYVPPPETGACCSSGQTCEELSAETCGNQGGLFLGGGTDCTPNLCPPDPVGACCAPSGNCSEVSAAVCDGDGGAWQGQDTTCAELECPVVLEPFVDPLPLPAVAQPQESGRAGTSYRMTVRELQQQLHRDLPPTTVWGFGDGASGGTFPGPTIEARTGQPITVVWANDLRDTSAPGDPKPLRADHYLDVDGTAASPDCRIHGAEDLPKTVVHLHGGHVPAEFDGYPEATFLPGDEVSYTYPNNQQAATLWYHDHALGITRLNVYMGLAGFYIVHDDVEDALGLPSCPDPGAPESCDDVPLVIQDRTFNPDGSLAYPSEWQDHFFGDKIVVNGKVWPYLDVRQGKYRLRLANGCTSRTLALSLDRSDVAGPADMAFWQIGAGGGLFELPVEKSEIVLAPGERADVVVDFELLAAGTEVLMTNSAPAPYPGSAGVGVVPEVMKFVVQDTPGHTGPLPAALRPLERLDELSAIRTRDFVLQQQGDACGSVWTINGLGWDEVTEYPQLGTTEIWRFINPGNSMHPMHMHLVFFQVLDRLPIGGGAPLPPEDNEIGWKDTARAEANTITRVIARFEDYPGLFAYHCHILEHEDHEMMRQFLAVDAVDLRVDPGTLSWVLQPGAASYDVVRGDLGALRESGGNFAFSTVTLECVSDDGAGTSVDDAAVPPPGAGYWYLVRSTDADGVQATYDSGSSFQVDPRDAAIAGSGNDCP